jgi:hypothetical protein
LLVCWFVSLLVDFTLSNHPTTQPSNHPTIQLPPTFPNLARRR